MTDVGKAKPEAQTLADVTFTGPRFAVVCLDGTGLPTSGYTVWDRETNPAYYSFETREEAETKLQMTVKAWKADVVARVLDGEVHGRDY